jgi:hypothetical protein
MLNVRAIFSHANKHILTCVCAPATASVSDDCAANAIVDAAASGVVVNDAAVSGVAAASGAAASDVASDEATHDALDCVDRPAVVIGEATASHVSLATANAILSSCLLVTVNVPTSSLATVNESYSRHVRRATSTIADVVRQNSTRWHKQQSKHHANTAEMKSANVWLCA